MKVINNIRLFEQLYKEYQPRLVAFAWQYLKSSENAKEVVQDVFIAIWNNRDNLREDGNLKSYLFTATKNKCLNFLEKKRLKTVSISNQSENDRPVLQVPSGEISSDETMELNELRASIFDEVQQLPPKCKQIFVLSREEGFSHKEIASQLGVSPKTVENQIGIALKRIRVRVNAHQAESDNLSIFIFPIIIDLILKMMAYLRDNPFDTV